MKKLFLLLSIIATMGFSSCKCDREAEMLILTHRIEYDVLVNNNKKMDPWFNHIEEAARVDFIHFLFTGLKDGKGFDDAGAPIETNGLLKMIRELIPDADTTVTDPEIFYKTNTITINKLRFREKWTYNSENFKIDKTVLAVAPLIEISDKLGYVIKAVPLFWIQCDTVNDLKDITVLSSNIISDAIVYNQLDMILYIDSAPAIYFSNLENPAKTKYFDGLLASVTKEKQPCYNYFFNPLEEADMRVLNGYNDTLTDYDENNNEVKTVIENKVSAKEFGRIKFAEKWEYSASPFVFRKTVMAINPSVFVIDKQYEIIKGFKPLFWTVYDENYLKEMKGKIVQ